MKFLWTLWPKNGLYGRHWLSLCVWIIALCHKTKQKMWLRSGRSMRPIRNTLLFLRLFAGTIRNRPLGHSTRPIRNTSLILRLYAGTIRNRTQGQSMRPIRNTSLFLGLHAGTIRESVNIIDFKKWISQRGVGWTKCMAFLYIFISIQSRSSQTVMGISDGG